MHHGSTPDPRIDKAVEGAEELVALAITELDEGELRFGLAYVDGKILVHFKKPVVWLGMSPAEAKDFARLLLKLANPITRGKT